MRGEHNNNNNNNNILYYAHGVYSKTNIKDFRAININSNALTLRV